MEILSRELEQCRQRRIVAWEQVERYRSSKVLTDDGTDLTSALLEQARADIELFDALVASLERMIVSSRQLAVSTT